MKVEKKNNWGYLEYYWGSIKLNAKLDGKIRLSNGVECDYKSVPYHETVSDHGKSYGVSSRKLVATVPFNEQMIQVDIEHLEIEWITPTP